MTRSEKPPDPRKTDSQTSITCSKKQGDWKGRFKWLGTHHNKNKTKQVKPNVMLIELGTNDLAVRAIDDLSEQLFDYQN